MNSKQSIQLAQLEQTRQKQNHTISQLQKDQAETQIKLRLYDLENRVYRGQNIVKQGALQIAMRQESPSVPRGIDDPVQIRNLFDTATLNPHPTFRWEKQDGVDQMQLLLEETETGRSRSAQIMGTQYALKEPLKLGIVYRWRIGYRWEGKPKVTPDALFVVFPTEQAKKLSLQLKQLGDNRLGQGLLYWQAQSLR